MCAPARRGRTDGRQGGGRRHRNLFTICAYTFLASAARSIWSGDILAAYVFLLTGNNTSVGVITGVRGIAQLALSPVFGWLADKGGRARMLRLAAIVGFLGAAIAAFGIHTGHYQSLCVAMAAWGVYWAIANPSADALFADSIADGQRSSWFTRKYQLTQLANAMGPLVSIVIFAATGNEWTKATCTRVLFVGIALTLVPNALILSVTDLTADELADLAVSARLCAAADGLPRAQQLSDPLLDDDSGGGDAEAAETDADGASGSIDSLGGEVGGAGLDAVQSGPGDDGAASLTAAAAAAEDGAVGTGGHAHDASKATAATDEEAASAVLAGATRTCCSGSLLLVPSLVCLYDVIGALASGMSIRFFPVFFLHKLELSPVHVNAIGIAAMVGIAACGSVVQRISRTTGRVAATVGFRLLGCACFIGMTALYQLGAPAAAVVAAYLVRTWVMNSTGGVTKSIIHDIVPPSQRARYAAVDSVNQATWAGSAAVGGVIIDRYGYVHNFYATACMQAMGLPCLLVARGMVPMEGRLAAVASSANLNGGDHEARGGGTYRPPELPAAAAAAPDAGAPSADEDQSDIASDVEGRSSSP